MTDNAWIDITHVGSDHELNWNSKADAYRHRKTGTAEEWKSGMPYQRLFDDDGICVHPNAESVLDDFIAKFDIACGTMNMNPRELAWAVSEALMANASDKIRRARTRRDGSHT